MLIDYHVLLSEESPGGRLFGEGKIDYLDTCYYTDHRNLISHFMRKQYFLTTVLLILLIASCKRKSEQITVTDVSMVAVKEDSALIEPPPPPPPSLHLSKPLTLQECFVQLSNNEHPEPADTVFHLGLYQIDDQYVVYFIDAKRYQQDMQDRMEKKASQYLNKYYPLKNTEFTDPAWEQVQHKIKTELTKFAATDSFKHSSLAKAGSISIRFEDGSSLRIK